MKRICSICARGGSKGVPGKNTRALLGKPLIAHSLAQAKSSGLFDALAVSSDSEEILSVARKWGADYAVDRPAEFATDHAPKIPAIRHCVATVEAQANHAFDTVVDLDATSPLRSIQDIAEAVRLLEIVNADNVITAMPARRSPYFNMVEVGADGVVHLAKPPRDAVVTRQGAPKCYDMNASIYVWRREVLFSRDTLFNAATRLYVMPEERSIDIDSEFDFKLVEFIMRSGLHTEQRARPDR